MRISLKTWMKYKNRLARINTKAAEDMERYVRSIGGYVGHERDVINYAYALATKYGEAAATAACEMYDAVAMAEGANVPPAEPAQTAQYTEVAIAVQGTAKNSSESQIPGTVSRLVKQAGADTSLQNAERDGAQFAWIPMGDTCSFCLTLASRGWQNISARSLRNGHAEHIHAHCDCTYATRFNSSTEVEGYDPDKYLEMYESAEGATPKDKINTMRRQQYAENADHINEQKREAYARRKENE